MKKNKFIKSILLCFIMLVSGTFLYSCNWLSNLLNPKPPAPTIEINRDEKLIYWQAQDDESIINYELYINKNLCKTINNISINNQFSCSFAEFMKNYGIYEINVCATSENSRSDFSNTITYVYSSTAEEVEEEPNIVVSPQIGVSNIVQNQTILSWDLVPYATKYAVLIFNNEFGYVNIQTTNNFIDLQDYLSIKTPSAMRVAAIYEDDNNLYVKNNDIIYYYTYSGTYGTSTYLFDGQLNDYYISSQSELENILYYNFINRDEEYYIRLSEDFATSIINASTKNETNINKIRRKITETFSNYINETSVLSFYIYNNEKEAFACNKASTGDFDYMVKVGYYGVEECLIDVDDFNTYTVSQSQQLDSIKPYYEVYDYSKDSRSNNTYFKSDNNFFKVNVTTSEQLYWAVENNYTPICTPNSRAEFIYNKAKTILNKIIGNNMSDFEKALAIYDYICSTTTYDKRKFNQEVMLDSYKTTHIPSFYLEGVFIKGLAVCDGFSKAFSLLCNMEGIDCIRIVGSAVQYSSSENHAWNKVKINGEWYIVDTTWAELSSGLTERLTHKYFLVTDEMTKTSHIPNKHRSKYFDYPTSSTAFDFFSNYKLSHTYSNNTTKITDLFINSDEEFINLINYCLINEQEYIEVFMERKYVIKSFTTNDSSPAYQYVGNKIKNYSLPYQLLTCYYSSNDYFCQSNVSGCIVVVKIENILTTKSQLDLFINYLSSEKVDNDYYFYLSESYLNQVYSDNLTYQSKIENLQNSYNHLNIDLDYIGSTTTYNAFLKAHLIKISFLS